MERSGGKKPPKAGEPTKKLSFLVDAFGGQRSQNPPESCRKRGNLHTSKMTSLPHLKSLQFRAFQAFAAKNMQIRAWPRFRVSTPYELAKTAENGTLPNFHRVSWQQNPY